jgi:hypothetical protein
MALVTVRVVRWTATGASAFLAGLSVRTLVETVLVALILVMAACWIYCWTVKDPGRTDRGVKLIRAIRGGASPRGRYPPGAGGCP